MATLLACIVASLATPPTDAATATASSLEAKIPSGTVAVHARLPVITGSVPEPAGRRVLLQAQTDTGWLSLRQTTTRTDGTFTFLTPTWWVGRRVLRAHAPASGDAAEATSATSVLTVSRRSPPRGGTAYRHLGGHQARWDACRVVRYRVNPRRLPAGALAEVKLAFRRLAEATGLRFTYVGPTSFVPYRRGGGSLQHADVAVAWATPRQVPGLAGSVVGLGGYAGVSGSPRWTRITQGYVVLDSTSALAPGFAGRRSTRGMTLLHELGHAVGLDHVRDRRQVMYPVMLPRPAQYASGDLRGLKAVGASRGCFPSTSSARFAAGHVTRSSPLRVGRPRSVVE